MEQAAVRIGCAFLNKVGSLTSGGVASLAGEEPFKFTSLETLAGRGDKWVVSTPETAFLVDEGQKYPFLRHAGFLATPLPSIALELGASDASKSALAAQRLSEVMTRVVGMACAMAPDLLSTLEQDSSLSLVQALRACVAPPLRHEPLPKELHDAMPSLIKAPGPMSGGGGQDLVIRVPANRLALSKEVLSSAIPAGEWTEVELDKFPTVNGALSWAVGNQKPVIALVAIRGTLPKVKATAPLMRNLTNGALRWMALPEIVALSRIVEMTPKRMFVASDLVPVDASLKVPCPVYAPAAAASISAGLFAEAYMHAVCSPAATSRVMDASELAAPQLHSVRAAWLTGVARAYMMQEAMALAEANFSVVGTGPSHVLVAVNRKNLVELRKAIRASRGLAYPAGLRQLDEKKEAVMEPFDMLTNKAVEA